MLLLPYTCAHESCVRPLPQPTVASSEAAERPRTVSRVVLTVLVSVRSNFRRSPHHLALTLQCSVDDTVSQTWSHDSRGDLLRRRVVSATRTTALSNSTTHASVRNVRCDPGWHGQLLTFLQSAGGEVVLLEHSRADCSRLGAQLEKASATVTAQSPQLQ